MKAPRTGGQALAEALAALSVLGALFALIPAVGRLQDLALQALLAGRHAAFGIAQGWSQPALRQTIGTRFFDPGRHRWLALDGRAMLGADGIQAWGAVAPPAARDGAYQIGGGDRQAMALRAELLFPDRGVTTGAVRLSPRLGAAAGGRGLGGPRSVPAGLHEWSSLRPAIARSTVLLSGEGAAGGDDAVQAAIARAGRAWQDAARPSANLARADDARLWRLDAGWQRPRLDTDWLQPWRGVVPADRLVPEVRR
ncbi:hypothetical protein GCM10023144_30730 [Pigmentiphaga soli]|uniref:General secretion pathway protein GspJ n=1 Tax=Pigmentiphaga soli TaxID=1007095 RepID=A0ABP8H9Y2_9BURK